MFSSRILHSSLVVSLALSSSACELIADFDRDRINETTVKPPEQLTPPVPPEQKPQPIDGGVEDAGMDAGGSEDADAGLDAGAMDSGLAEDAGPDAEAGDAGTDAETDAGAGDAGDDASTDAAF